jgi:hypothetical protein
VTKQSLMLDAEAGLHEAERELAKARGNHAAERTALNAIAEIRRKDYEATRLRFDIGAAPSWELRRARLNGASAKVAIAAMGQSRDAHRSALKEQVATATEAMNGDREDVAIGVVGKLELAESTKRWARARIDYAIFEHDRAAHIEAVTTIVTELERASRDVDNRLDEIIARCSYATIQMEVLFPHAAVRQKPHSSDKSGSIRYLLHDKIWYLSSTASLYLYDGAKWHHVVRISPSPALGTARFDERRTEPIDLLGAEFFKHYDELKGLDKQSGGNVAMFDETRDEFGMVPLAVVEGNGNYVTVELQNTSVSSNFKCNR